MRRQTVMGVVWFVVLAFVIAPIIYTIFFYHRQAGVDSFEAGRQTGKAFAPVIFIIAGLIAVIGTKIGILPGTKD
jgi:hypothetical protein